MARLATTAGLRPSASGPTWLRPKHGARRRPGQRRTPVAGLRRSRWHPRAAGGVCAPSQAGAFAATRRPRHGPKRHRRPATRAVLQRLRVQKASKRLFASSKRRGRQSVAGGGSQRPRHGCKHRRQNGDVGRENEREYYARRKPRRRANGVARIRIPDRRHEPRRRYEVLQLTGWWQCRRRADGWRVWQQEKPAPRAGVRRQPAARRWPRARAQANRAG